ncbi:uncharacterized protein LOC127082172 [Lathyrus oleraceus]|uniref:uncharacterized protein LOC127082172 n=1 Tax=Pisum sativum TaxID=3888 RepID=UPI0021D027C7|nr:uncharacterized protein LOC127082172 [Pisum sativum]
MVAEGVCSLGKTLPSKKPVDVSHETAENVINMEEASSEEEVDTLVHHVKPSVARKLKTIKGKTVVEMMTTRKCKKVVGVGPSKSWSNVETIKKSPAKVAAVHLDNISFHLEDGAAKWKFVIQTRVVVERELGKEAVEVKEVMELIKNEYISPNSDLYATLSLVSVAGVVVMVIAFSLGLGAMPWIIMSEILPINIKGLAGSFATLANWFFSWLVTLTTNLLLDWSSGGTFTIYTAVCVFTAGFVTIWVPETKGKTLEEIQQFFR